MKRIILLLLIIIPAWSFAQLGLGIGISRGSAPTPAVKTFGTPIQWLDGTISGTTLVDKSGHGYDVDIVGMDFVATKGIPYKSACYIQQKIANYGRLNDSTHFWFNTTNHTANLIPVTSLFQDISYGHFTFCRHQAQVLDGNGVEITEPSVVEIVNYSAALATTKLTTAQAYFAAPTEDVNAKWVDISYTGGSNDGSKAHPWTNIYSASAVAGTVYVKTGTYPATTLAYHILNHSSLVLQAVGLCRLQSQAAQTYCVKSAKGSTIRGFIIDGVNSTYGFYCEDSYSPTIEKCFFVNCVRSSYTLSGVTLMTFTNDVFNASSTANTYGVWVQGPFFLNTCMFSGTAGASSYAIRTQTRGSVLNSKLTANYVIQLLATQATGAYTLKGNTVTNYSQAFNIAGTNVNSVRHTVAFNTINAAVIATEIRNYIFLNTKDTTYINHNSINKLYDAIVNTTVQSIYSKSTCPSFVDDNTIIDYSYPSSLSIMIDQVTQDNVGACSIQRNTITVKAKDGAGIQLGGENYSANNAFPGSIIDGNSITSSSAIYGSLHGILCGWGDNLSVTHNRIQNCDLGIVMKDGTRAYTSGGIGHNVVIDAVNALMAKGTGGGMIFYNNTCFSTKTISNELMAAVYSDAASPSTRPSINVVFTNNIFRSYSAATHLWIDNASCTGNTMDNTTVSDASGAIARAVYLNATSTAYTLVQAKSANIFAATVSEANPNINSVGIPNTAITGNTMSAAYQTGLDITYDWVTRTMRNQGNSWTVGAYVKP